MQRYLVTGGAGFIGSHLTEALLQAGHAVRVLDDLSTGKRTNLPPHTDLIIGDIADRATMANAVRGIDGCFHLAAIASVERGAQDWLGTHRTNLTGAITLFDALGALPGPARPPVVYASSAAVYGSTAAPPVAETAACEPLSAYGADKYGCELHARIATHVHAVATTGLRFFNVYGPRQDPKSPYSGAISIFCDRIARGMPFTIFGDGDQTRDFIYVSDVVMALQSAMANLMSNAPNPTANVFNICTGRPSTIRDVATTIAELCGNPAELVLEAPRAGEIRHSHGAPALARSKLGFTAKTSLPDGLRNVLAWLQTETA